MLTSEGDAQARAARRQALHNSEAEDCLLYLCVSLLAGSLGNTAVLKPYAGRPYILHRPLQTTPFFLA